jgi:prolyl 4-hydroxylase
MKRLSLYLIILSTSLFASHKEKNSLTPEFRKICDLPEVYECEHFLTGKDCDKIIEGARPLLTRSTVVDLNSSNGLVDPRRSSLGMFFSRSTEGKTVQKIRKNITSIAGIPAENGEDMQVLHYKVGGEYQPHYDYFDPSTPGGLIHFNRGGQRVATLLVYLNTVEKGGETIFPKANLAITPTKGKAVLFYNVKHDGKIDPKSFHGGAPVIAGEKWIATIWLRERKFE